jgi:hypothetical protein
MIYFIIVLILIVVLALLVWKNPKKESLRTRIVDRVYDMVKRQYSAMPESSYYHPISVDLPSVVETEDKLLAMARNPAPHPQFVFNSRLRSEGNPIVGDLKIVPRKDGVYVPLIAEPADLQVGYFST